MSQPQDGGPAFATPTTTYKTWEGRDEMEQTEFGHPGMSLRDYFAGQTLVGALADGAIQKYATAGLEASEAVEYVAQQCYAVADAMLKAREVNHA